MVEIINVIQKPVRKAFPREMKPLFVSRCCLTPNTTKMKARSIPSAADITAVKAEKVLSKAFEVLQGNNLEKMVNNIYYEAGASSQLFAATGNLSLENSITNDTAFMSPLINKFSNYLTNIINTVFANNIIEFKYNILPITNYNYKDYLKSFFLIVHLEMIMHLSFHYKLHHYKLMEHLHYQFHNANLLALRFQVLYAYLDKTLHQDKRP